jgi:hypothetical protein
MRLTTSKDDQSRKGVLGVGAGGEKKKKILMLK